MELSRSARRHTPAKNLIAAASRGIECLLELRLAGAFTARRLGRFHLDTFRLEPGCDGSPDLLAFEHSIALPNNLKTLAQLVINPKIVTATRCHWWTNIHTLVYCINRQVTRPAPRAGRHRHRIANWARRMLALALHMADMPPPDPPPGPPPAPQVPVEAVLPDTEEAKRLFLGTEAIRRRARELSEEVKQKLQHLDVPIKPENNS